LPLLFTLAVFLNAALLFAVEPLIAKMILPHLGGTPAVWNTCMVFFQAILLAGYAGAHALATRFSGRHALLWTGFQLLVCLILPIHLSETFLNSVPQEANPIPWLMGLLLIAVGLPFFVLAMNGPLLQRWFTATGHPTAADPYFLYAAGTLGSMIALVSYPAVIEPGLGVVDQTWAWALAYVALVVLTWACATMLKPRVASRPGEQGPLPAEPLTMSRRLRWVALAFVPSSMMLGVTTYLSTDIATIPLLWVIPLALYLLTFIIVFARRRIIPRGFARRALPIAVLVLAVCLLCEDMQPPVGLMVALHPLAFFIMALFCHQELADDRPAPSQLTEFYLWLAAGGVLGGLFNALVAPLLFNRVVEYPLGLVLVCLLRSSPRLESPRPVRAWLDAGLPLALACLTAALVLGLQGSAVQPAQLRVGLMFGLPAILCFTLADRPLRFALAVAAVLLTGSLYTGAQGRPVYVHRSFFGVLRVTLDASGTFHQLMHGNTVHGRQRLPLEPDPEPLAYYHRTGPIGTLFRTLAPRLAEANIGVVGLGIGSLAAYAQPNQHWTYYEIDPAVKRLAFDDRYFTFLSSCRAGKLEVILGDARLRLREAAPKHYNLLILDAFSSDAVPVHLLTREAMTLYRDKLAPGGVLAFHISNRYLDLKPVLGNLAEDAGWVARVWEDLDLDPRDKENGKDPSQWVILALSTEELGPLAKSSRWTPLGPIPRVGVWNDDFSNLLGIFRWSEWGGD
jgi:SAM-dependent methyltransferase